MGKSVINDLGTAIMQLQRAFRQHHIEPAIIELASWDEGARLKHLIGNDPAVMLMPIDPEKAMNQIEIAGTIIRWPTQIRALESGGYQYE